MVPSWRLHKTGLYVTVNGTHASAIKRKHKGIASVVVKVHQVEQKKTTFPILQRFDTVNSETLDQ